jgi:adenylylsulfate kinase
MNDPETFRKFMERRLGQKAKVLWLTGLPCSGKTTLGLGLESLLLEKGFTVRMLDGDVTRKGLCSDLGFSAADRTENIRRVAEVSRLLADSGIITINAFITPTDDLRQMAADIIGRETFISIYIDAPLHICEKRDVKGMYRKARLGQLPDFTGVSSPFDPPVNADFTINTADSTPDQNIQELLRFILPKINFLP